MGKYGIKERIEWRRWVTPKPLEEKPIHRWYIFPHSFSSELVYALIDEWGLGENDHILDPFAGAGTTLLAAKEKGIPATGYDLSPLAVFVTSTKLNNLSLSSLKNTWNHLNKVINPNLWNGSGRNYPDLVRKALPGKLLGAFDALDREITGLAVNNDERSFFRLALLATIPYFSRAVATGGWLKWVKKSENISSVLPSFSNHVNKMIADLQYQIPVPNPNFWNIEQSDARTLPDKSPIYSAVITSPPYPNRHDYTRVFGVELMFGFLNWEETRQLRYQSFHSHPEARPRRPEIKEYKQPNSLTQSIEHIKKNSNNLRIPQMLEGYFLDMYLVLREIKRVCRKGARIAIVIGNAQYCGEKILVDELTAEVGERSGLSCKEIIVARYRGNSAQQMGIYGRNPSRESVVVFKND